MFDWHNLSSHLAFILGAPICFAYIRIAGSASPIVRHMSVSLFCVVAAFSLRALFWGIADPLGDGFWAGDTPGAAGILINVVWNLIFAYGCWRGLQALHLMVPIEDRPNWPVWKAWLYPPAFRLRDIMRRR